MIKANQKYIVFCPDHFNPLGIIRSLGEEGIKPIVIVHANKSILVKYSKYIEKIHIVQTIEEGCAVMIEKYGNEPLKPFVYAASDDIESELDKRYDSLKEHFHFYNASEAGRVTKMMEKSVIVEMAEQCGLRIPKTEIVKRGEMPLSLSYPILTKASISTIENWKSNVYICHNENELEAAFSKIKCEDVILQEYIQKVDELNIEGFCINDGKDVFMPLQNRFYRTTADSYGNYLYIDKLLPEELEGPIRNLFAMTGYNGIFEMEFMIDAEGRFYFLEINFRNSAWVYAYTKCGLNFFTMYPEALLSGKLPEYTDEMCKKLPFRLMDELTDFKWSVLGGKVSLWQWMKELKSVDCIFYYNKGDKMPFFYYLCHRILRALKLE